MNKIQHHLAAFKKSRISTIVRTATEELAYRVVKASVAAGIKFIEITLTVPNAYKLIERCSTEFPEVCFGAGTVLTMEEAKTAVAHKAQYLVSPVMDLEILAWANGQDVLFASGALTPSEVYQLYSHGAALIKYYPATAHPADYVKLIMNPLPNINLLATGGIDQTNLASFIQAGCVGVGVTAELGGPRPDISDDELLAIAKQYVAKVNSVK